MSNQVYLVRISPRANTYSYKHPLLHMVIRKSTDPRDAQKGWVEVNEEQANILRKKRIGGGSDPHAPPLFDVMTQEEAIVLQQREMEKLGLGTPENPVGGSPAQMAKIRQLEGEVAQTKSQNVLILGLLQAIVNKIDPALAAQLKGATPESITLDLAPPVIAPASIFAPPEAPPAPVPVAPAAPPPGPKQRPAAGGPQPGAPAAAAPKGGPAPKQRPGADPASLTSKLREEGKIGDVPTTDIGGNADAESA